MVLSNEFQEFYRTWMTKAAEYGTEELRDCFDKFFTLFVVYNRLYAEVTFTLVRKRRIPRIERDINNPGTMRRIFPDRMAATHICFESQGLNCLRFIDSTALFKRALPFSARAYTLQPQE